MSSIRLQSTSDSWAADGPRTFTIGREPACDVIAEDPLVSRRHAEIRPAGDGWEVVDLGSSHGVWVNGQRVQRHVLSGTTTIRFGQAGSGFDLTATVTGAAGAPAVTAMAPGAPAPTAFTPAGPPAPPAPAPPAPAPPPVAPPFQGPSPQPAFAPPPPPQKKSSATLLIVGAAVLVLLVVAGGLTAVVLASGDGGDGDGESGSTSSGQSADGGKGLSEAELDRAKAATVFLQIHDPDGNVVGSGSGSVISDDGLILTNSHVAKPDAPGNDSDPIGFVTVGFTNPDDDDEPVELRYRGESIVADGVADLAVVQISADADGNEVDTSDLDLPEPLPIGDGDSLRTNDEITALGFPSLVTATSDYATEGALPALTVTTGRIATFVASEILESERGEIDADLRIGSGNSGGPAIDENGEIVGLNTRVLTERISESYNQEGENGGGQFTGGSARVVPIELASEVIDIAESGGDASYESPYLEAYRASQGQMTGGTEGEQPSGTATIEGYGWAQEGSQGSCEGVSTPEAPQILSVVPGEVIYAQFVVSGLTAEQVIVFDLYDFTPGTDPTLLTTVEVTWSPELDGQCAYVDFEVPEGVGGLNAAPKDAAGSYLVQNVVSFQ